MEVNNSDLRTLSLHYEMFSSTCSEHEHARAHGKINQLHTARVTLKSFQPSCLGPRVSPLIQKVL